MREGEFQDFRVKSHERHVHSDHKENEWWKSQKTNTALLYFTTQRVGNNLRTEDDICHHLRRPNRGYPIRVDRELPLEDSGDRTEGIWTTKENDGRLRSPKIQGRFARTVGRTITAPLPTHPTMNHSWPGPTRQFSPA